MTLKRLCRAVPLALVLALPSCDGPAARTDGGGVLLSVTDFDGLPIAVSVNEAAIALGFVQVDQLIIANVPKSQVQPISPLMNVEIKSYRVDYTRLDQGTRLPPPLVRGLFGVVPVGGTATYNNLPIMGPEQLLNPPLSDLLFSNGAFDRETLSQLISLSFRLTFFGETLNGKEVVSQPVDFAIEFAP
jgi:hypothetical protein